MVKKIKNQSDLNKDLTRIEDLSEFLHQDDDDLDSKFESFNPQDLDLTTKKIIEAPPALPIEALDDVSFEMGPLSDDTIFESQISEDSLFDSVLSEEAESELEALPDIEILSEAEENTEEDTEEDDTEEDDTEEPEAYQYTGEQREAFEAGIIEEPERTEVYTNTSEKFEDVRSFAQNFSYGKASVGGGNPPFTIIVREIKYKEDAETIFEFLNEFGVITPHNEKDTLTALELGSLIVPQISEYTAIVLAHKLRRFDLEIEVGLSDEVHPSKSGDSNPRGLLKKSNLKQNRSESLKLSDIKRTINDIIVSTSATLPGFTVDTYLGVQTAFAIVEEAELEKLQYVQKVKRDHGDIIDYENIDNPLLTSEKAFKDYQGSFDLLYQDLSMQLKQKAFTQNANALLGLTYQVSPLQFDRSHSRMNAWQITCSATLAVVVKENV